MKFGYLLFCYIMVTCASCKESYKQEKESSYLDRYMEKVDSIIRTSDPYVRQDAYRRFTTYNFNMDSNLNLDPAFPFTMILANYDTLTRKLTSIGILYFKNRKSTYEQKDLVSYDSFGKLIRILGINDENPNNQKQASYYFRNDSLVFQDTLHLKKDLETYLAKIDSISQAVRRTLIKKGYLDGKK